MNRQGIALLVASFFVVSAFEVAHAQSNQCYLQQRAVQTTQRNADAAANRLRQSEDRYLRTEDTLGNRRLGYEAQVAQARANEDAVRSINAGQTVNCVFRSIFNFGRGCWGGSISNNMARRGRARAQVQAAEARLRSFDVYAQGAVYREGLRVEQSKRQYEIAEAQYLAALSAYSRCLDGSGAY